MENVLEQSEVGREIARQNYEQGFAQGFARARVDVMRTLLRAKYGEVADLDDLARLLVDRDRAGSIARVVAGATLAELRS